MSSESTSLEDAGDGVEGGGGAEEGGEVKALYTFTFYSLFLSQSLPIALNIFGSKNL